MSEGKMNYIEQKFSQLVTELKNKNCLSQEFEFLTEAERKQKTEDYINEFIQQTNRL